MINNKEDLRRYLEMDKFALGVKRKKPKLLGDEIWKFEIVLRKHEYYSNCGKGIFHNCLKWYYEYRHHQLGVRLGLQIPCNVFAGGYGLTIMD